MTTTHKKRGRPAKLVCPECSAKYNAAHSLGRHRQTAHGVPGSSYASVAKRRLNLERTHTNGATTANEQAIAFWIGTLTSGFTRDIEVIAHRIGITSAELTERCIATLSGSSKEIRERYRIPDPM